VSLPHSMMMLCCLKYSFRLVVKIPKRRNPHFLLSPYRYNSNERQHRVTLVYLFYLADVNFNFNFEGLI
jgi:hypothetical protein